MNDYLHTITFKITFPNETFGSLNRIYITKGFNHLSSCTNIYCSLIFVSNEVIDLKEFRKDFQLYERLTWVKGDLQFPEYETSARLESRITVRSETSEDNDGEAIINAFFEDLLEKKERLLQLKEKYSGEIFFEIIINLESDDSPIVRLQSPHLALLTELDATLDSNVYDYKERA